MKKEFSKTILAVIILVVCVTVGYALLPKGPKRVPYSQQTSEKLPSAAVPAQTQNPDATLTPIPE